MFLSFKSLIRFWRIYLETMNEILPQIDQKIIVDESLRQLLPISTKPGRAAGNEEKGLASKQRLSPLLLLCSSFSPVRSIRLTRPSRVIITHFGKPVDDPITESGLHFKLPFMQSVNSLDKRFLEWDGAPFAIPTRDKTHIRVDTFAR